MNKGFTLIEMIVYIAILGVMAVSMTRFVGLLSEARLKNQVALEVEQQGSQAMRLITQTVRNASSITSPTAGNSASSVTLVVPTPALSPTIFGQTGNALYIKEGAGANVSLTNSRVVLSGLSFQNLTPSGASSALRIVFTLTYVNATSKQIYNYSRTFRSTAILRP